MSPGVNVCKTEAAWREQLREKKNYRHHKENNFAKKELQTP